MDVTMRLENFEIETFMDIIDRNRKLNGLLKILKGRSFNK